MKKKCFTAFSEQINASFNSLSNKYNVYCELFKRKVAEEKASSCSWGGYQELQYVQKFNKDIRKDINEIISQIELLASEVNRKFTDEQLATIEKIISQHIKVIVLNYRKSFESAMGSVNRTLKVSFDLTENNIISEIHSRFSVYQFKSVFKRDTALICSIMANVISIISLCVTMIVGLIT